MYINVLGADHFSFEIVEECSKEELDKKEQDYIKLFDSINSGYNSQIGGYNNSQGEGNGRALLTEEDVYYIRQAYADHKRPKAIYEEFKDKITKNQFQAVWQGRSWSYIMPEVFTPENKEYYTKGLMQDTADLTRSEILEYRKYYVNHTAKEVYKKYLQDRKGKTSVLKERTFIRNLTGDVRENSIYNQVPIYKKTTKRWELNGEPVSTIPETWE